MAALRVPTFCQINDFVTARERAKAAEIQADLSRNHHHDDLDHHRSHTQDRASDEDFGMDL
jgi:hypothetical protein